MHFILKRPDGLALSLAALSLAALVAPAAHAQDLFVTNTGSNTVSRFAGTGPGTFSKTATATLSDPSLQGPAGLAFDAKGDLFAANSNTSTITEFAAGTFKPVTTFATGQNFPEALTFDAKGDLFAANEDGASITEFAFNAVAGTFGAGTPVVTGLNQPVGLAFDSKGDLFAANLFGNGGGGSITEATAGASGGALGANSLFAAVSNPEGLAFDAKGDLFASSGFGNGGAITEFAFNTGTGTFGTATSFATGLTDPLGLIFDAQGNLLVATGNGGNAGAGTVMEFGFSPGVGGAAGTFGAAHTVATSLTQPAFLAFGPSQSPVPEASTLVSLGLLLGLGGACRAVRKRRKAV